MNAPSVFSPWIKTGDFPSAGLSGAALHEHAGGHRTLSVVCAAKNGMEGSQGRHLFTVVGTRCLCPFMSPTMHACSGSAVFLNTMQFSEE